MHPKEFSRSFAALLFVLHFVCSNVIAQEAAKPSAPEAVKPPHIHVVYFGGNDCPPCVVFRGTEFIKLQKSAAFSKMEWTYVTKAIGSGVPSSFFLPEKIKHLRDKLNEATNGNRGSAQVVILVNGEVHDVFFGSKDAAFYEQMVASVLDGKTAYPGERCVKHYTNWICSKKA